MNNSKVFTSSKLAKANLEAVLAEINEYLTSGQGTTKIQFIGVRNKVLSTKQMNSNWTTSNGRLRVETIHKEFVYVLTKVDSLPFGTVKVKVTSPFVESQTTHVKTQVDAILPFTYTATA